MSDKSSLFPKAEIMKAACLIYYSDPDPYDGRDVPFALVESEERAKTICAEIIEFGQKLAAQMKYPFEEDISEEEYYIRSETNLKLYDSEWPYKWVAEYYSDFEVDWTSSEYGEPVKMRFNNSTVSYKQLRIL